MKHFLKLFFGLIFLSITIVIGYYILPESKLPKHIRVDKIVVEKSKRKMHVYSRGEKLKTYTISLGFRPQGRKQVEGDGRTPEGTYFIVSKNHHSMAHKSFGISYPTVADRRNAAKYRKSAGGNIMIHGMMNGLGYWGKFHRFVDWTAGCIAVTNNEMDDLFRHVEVGCKIEILK